MMYLNIHFFFAVFAVFSNVLFVQSTQTIKLPIKLTRGAYILRTSPKSNAIIIGIDNSSSRVDIDPDQLTELRPSFLDSYLIKNLSRAQQTHIQIYRFFDERIWILTHAFPVDGALFELAISDFGEVIAFARKCETSESECLRLLHLHGPIYSQDTPDIILGNCVDIISEHLKLDSTGDTIQVSSVFMFNRSFDMKVEIYKRKCSGVSKYERSASFQRNFFPTRFFTTEESQLFGLGILSSASILASNDLFKYFVAPESVNDDTSSGNYAEPGSKQEHFNVVYCVQRMKMRTLNYFKTLRRLYLVSNYILLRMFMSDDGLRLLSVDRIIGSNRSLVRVFDYKNLFWNSRAGINIPIKSVPTLSGDGRILAIYSLGDNWNISVHRYDERSRNWVEFGRPVLPHFRINYGQIALSHNGKSLAFQGVVGEDYRFTDMFLFLFLYNDETMTWEKKRHLANFRAVAFMEFVDYSRSSISSRTNFFHVFDAPDSDCLIKLHAF